MTPLLLQIHRRIQKDRHNGAIAEYRHQLTDAEWTMIEKGALRVSGGRLIDPEHWQRRVACCAVYRWLRRVKKFKKAQCIRPLADAFRYTDHDTELHNIVHGSDSTLTFEAEALLLSDDFDDVLARYGFSKTVNLNSKDK